MNTDYTLRARAGRNTRRPGPTRSIAGTITRRIFLPGFEHVQEVLRQRGVLSGIDNGLSNLGNHKDKSYGLGMRGSECGVSAGLYFCGRPAVDAHGRSAALFEECANCVPFVLSGSALTAVL